MQHGVKRCRMEHLFLISLTNQNESKYVRKKNIKPNLKAMLTESLVIKICQQWSKTTLFGRNTIWGQPTPIL